MDEGIEEAENWQTMLCTGEITGNLRWQKLGKQKLQLMT